VPMVMAVDEVTVRIAESVRSTISILATGKVPTTGWSGGSLVRRASPAPPPDGILEFEFSANAPASTGLVLQVITPINAHLELPDVDIANFWAPGARLVGIRVAAANNAKTVEIVPHDEAVELSRKSSPRAVAIVVPDTPAALGFEVDIKPMFRPRDVNAMRAAAGFDLHNYEDVKSRAALISERLKDDMPCDGLWPPEDIKKFDDWIAAQMPA
jgi:hypothetical protein